MVVGPGSAAFETIRALVDRLPAMVCPRWVSTPTQPIALRDVVRYLVGACGLELPQGESTTLGAEVMTYREMIERIARSGETAADRRGHRLDSRLSSGAPPRDPGQRGSRTAADRRAAHPDDRPENRIRELVPFELTLFDDAVREALLDLRPRRVVAHRAVRPRRRAARAGHGLLVLDDR